jgi:hypothetical protein
MFDSLFDEDDDGSFGDDYVIVATFPSQYRGVCRVDETHSYKRGDYVGKLESASNPFIPVTGVACARCVRMVPHKKSLT